MANRTVTVSLVARVAGYVASMKTAAASTKQLGQEIVKAAERGRADNLIRTATIIGTGLVAAFGVAVIAAAKFDQKMSEVAAASGATAGEMDRLREAALQAGKDTAFSASEAAQAEIELAKAGVAVADILGGGLKGALDLAAAGQIEVKEAAELAAIAMTQFGLSGQDIPHVADLLAAAAGKAQGEVTDMGMALKQSGLVASQFGVSIEETTGVLAAFASAGLIGSDAGTSLKTMLLRLANPAAEAAEKMEALGIAAYDSQGRFVGLEALAGQLQDGLAGLTQAERDAALSIIFGSDAIRAANVLYKEGAQGIDAWVGKVNDQGFAADTAAKKMDNLAGDIERLKGSLETLLITSGSGANSGLRILAQTVEKLVNAFAGLPGPIQSGLVLFAGIAGATLLAAAGFLKAKQVAAELKVELIAMGPAGAAASGALGRLGTVGSVALGKLGKLVAILAALQVASAAFGDTSARSSARLNQLGNDLAKYGKSGKAAGEATKALGKDLEKFNNDIQVFADDFWSKFGTGIADTVEGLTGLGDVFDDSAKHARENIHDIDSALAELVSSGNQEQAAAAFERLRVAAGKSGISMRELKEAFPEYFAALRESKEETDAATAGAVAMAGGMQAAAEAGKTLIEVFNDLNGAAISLAEAEIAAEAAVDDMTESLKKNGKSFNIATAAGRENMSTLLDGVKAAAAAAQAKFEETGSVEAAEAEYQRYIAALRASMIAAGKTEAEVDRLLGTYARMPPSVTTRINTPGLGAAQSLAKSLKGTLQWLNGRQIVIYTDIRGDTYARLPGGRIPERHGGIVHAARHGMVTPAHVARGTQIKFAEPETGGEAFIPRIGNNDRSRKVLDVAASWYGGSVNWGGRGGAGGGLNVENLNLTAYPGERFSLRQVQDELAFHGAA